MLRYSKKSFWKVFTEFDVRNGGVIMKIKIFKKQHVRSPSFKSMLWKLRFIVASGVSFWTKMYAWTKRCCPTEQNVNRCQVQLIWHNFPYFIFPVLWKDYKLLILLYYFVCLFVGLSGSIPKERKWVSYFLDLASFLWRVLQ